MQDLIAKIVSEVVAPLSEKPACTGDPADCSTCGQCAVQQPDRVDQIAAAGADRITLTPAGITGLKSGIARLIDHTLLKPEATEAEIRRLCEEALRHGFASVCVHPCWVPLCAQLVANGPLKKAPPYTGPLKKAPPYTGRVKVCTVVGFPLGANRTDAKAFEASKAVQDGAQELDMVINVGWLKSGKVDEVEEDIRQVVKAARDLPLKVIIETCLLTDPEKVQACILAQRAGAAFVKTSTGFAKGGATVGDVALMRRVVGPQMGIKAAGGVRELGQALQMVEAGATRIGASASVAIVS